MIARLLSVALLLAASPAIASSQGALTIEELELRYSSKFSQHQAAYSAWEALDIRFLRALDSLNAAEDSGNSDRSSRAYTVFQQVAGQIRVQKSRVDEFAEELRAARADLLVALGERLEVLIQEVEAATDPQEQRGLTAILEDWSNRALELRAEEDPETTLEPFPELIIDPRDTPEIINRKARSLENRGTRYEAQAAGVSRRLEELRQDQRRVRSVRDLVADVERYDDTRLPVVSPGTLTNPPDPGQLPTGADSLGVEVRPLTLEERIQALETLQQELELRLEQIRDKAERFRRIARGGEVR